MTNEYATTSSHVYRTNKVVCFNNNIYHRYFTCGRYCATRRVTKLKYAFTPQ